MTTDTQSIDREKLRIEAACAAKELGITEQYAELMAKFESAKKALINPSSL